MKKKGFTLVELLGVLIILSAIVLIVFPSILNQVKKSQGKIDKATQMILTSAAELYLGEHKNKYGLLENDVYCISIDTLIKNEKLSVTVKEQEKIDPSYFIKASIGENKEISYKLVESCVEINTTPEVPGDSDLQPGSGQAPIIEFTGSNYLADTATSFNALDGVVITDDRTPRKDIQVTITGFVSLGVIGKYSITYEAVDRESNVTTKTRVVEIIKTEYVLNYIGTYQKFDIPIDGIYKIELWGASGGDYSTTLLGGKGAYTSGKLSLEEGQSLYFYLGGKGGSNQTTTNVGGYNGGGYSGNNSGGISMGGGGATDVRYFTTTPTAADLVWNSALGLRSRIMVAAGGGGTVYSSGYSVSPGYGGALTGGAGSGNYNSVDATGGTQTSGGTGYTSNQSGYFGYGAQSNVSGWGGGAGSGYYAGGTGHGKAGAGGSSFISGYLGCIAVASKDSNSPKDGCSNGQGNVACSHHYSGQIFTDSVMKAGNDSTMPNHAGTGFMTGNAGDGYAKITLILE